MAHTKCLGGAGAGAERSPTKQQKMFNTSKSGFPKPAKLVWTSFSQMAK
jgi:hypothetical protein